MYPDVPKNGRNGGKIFNAMVQSVAMIQHPILTHNALFTIIFNFISIFFIQGRDCKKNSFAHLLCLTLITLITYEKANYVKN